jgi:hypothetical protein
MKNCNYLRIENNRKKFENDSLWLSSGIEGDKFFHELTFFAVRTTAPKGYENW